MTCHKCHVANLAHNIPYPQFTRKGYQPRTHAFTLLTRLDEVKPYLVSFFFLPQFEDIACGSTSGVWWRICTRRIGPMECQSGCPAGQLNDFDHLPCMPRSPGVRARSVFILLAPLNHLAPLPALAPFVPVAPLNVLALHHRQAGQLERLRRFALFCLTVKQTKFPTIFSSVYSTMTCRDLASHGVVSVCCLFALRFGFVNIKDVGHFCSHI